MGWTFVGMYNASTNTVCCPLLFSGSHLISSPRYWFCMVAVAASCRMMFNIGLLPLGGPVFVARKCVPLFCVSVFFLGNLGLIPDALARCTC